MISPEEGRSRLAKNMGTYVFLFTDQNGKEYCIDAMLSHNICKFVNESPKEFANAQIWVLEGRNGEPPVLGLYSTKVINKGWSYLIT